MGDPDTELGRHVSVSAAGGTGRKHAGYGREAVMSDAGCPLPQNLLFDLDGTLLDSLPGIRFSAEAAFRACGLEVGKTELRSLIGPPIRKIMERMAVRQLSGEELDALERSFRWSYDTEGWRMTPHYEAAAESLRELKASGRRLFGSPINRDTSPSGSWRRRGRSGHLTRW